MSQEPSIKKVGILTLPLTHNYGGILQCVALQKVLENLECNVLILDRKYPEPYWKRLLKSVTFGYYFAEIEGFKKKYLRSISRPIRTSKQLKVQVEEHNLTTVVVGSDQVWRAEYVSGFSKDYFLESLAEIPIKKIAYAASFGTKTIEPIVTTDDVSELLEKFSGISVREDAGLKILEHTFYINNASLALDPTLLVPASFYEAVITEAKTTPLKDTVAVYLLDKTEEKLTQIHQLADEMGLPVCQVKHQANHSLGRIFQQKKGIASWLQTIKNADFVVTDSYHGMLFAIIFKKQFVVWVNEKRGAVRFTSLAKQLGLEDRLVKNLAIKGEAFQYHKKIDYKTVYSKLALLQEKSLAFLKNHLN